MGHPSMYTIKSEVTIIRADCALSGLIIMFLRSLRKLTLMLFSSGQLIPVLVLKMLANNCMLCQLIVRLLHRLFSMTRVSSCEVILACEVSVSDYAGFGLVRAEWCRWTLAHCRSIVGIFAILGKTKWPPIRGWLPIKEAS